MSALLVRQAGVHTTVQDRGRFGFQAQGVPVSGALDPEMLRLANALVGNGPYEAGLEIIHAGPALEVEAESARVALAAFGGSLQVEGERARTIPPWRSVTLKRGQRIFVKGTGQSVCAYLAIEGGFDLPTVLGSLSTYVRGHFGGFEGRALKSGDRIPLKRAGASDRADMCLSSAPKNESGPLRVVPGPQADLFAPEAFEILCSSTYTVGRNSDRMGLRLEGPELPHLRGHDIVSDGIVTGAIQVPGDRRPVLLIADRQTAGGYPKIGAVATCDLPRAGRLGPGDKVRFAAVTVAEAQILARRRSGEIEALASNLKAAGGEFDPARLYDTNLVSGVVAGEPDEEGGQAR
ncbi:MAG: biotin-dependent carboxyltransferase [Rhodospirillales bacterium]|nr:biotin-dependent carboxyltransferase [Rhodospirillales bacterium]MSP79537.1 biotin-dependent carboxyltransferase [Rhodospirillales bacterium]